MRESKKLIRFDWAMKKLFRDKANYDILEGFLSELLGEDVLIQSIKDSESNKDRKNDKHNRVDILVENSKGELVIIEVQNSKEFDYLHRILYGTSKAISENMTEGAAYSEIKKVISVTIAYFDLGQGQDYVYHGKNAFVGIHKGDVLGLSLKQQDLYSKTEPHQIFPEYYLIKVDQFNEKINDKLDEWIYFLKTGAVQDNFTAKGLSAAKAKMAQLQMTDEEYNEYQYYIKDLRDLASYQYNRMIEIQEELDEASKTGIAQGLLEGKSQGLIEGKSQGLIEGKIEGKIEMIIEMYNEGMPIGQIAKIAKQSEEEIKRVIENRQ